MKYSGRVEGGVFKEEIKLLYYLQVYQNRSIDTFDGPIKSTLNVICVTLKTILILRRYVSERKHQPFKQDIDVMICWMNVGK